MDSSIRLEASGVEASQLLAVVADPVRWRLLAALADGGTRCVCDLQPIAAVPGNLLSYHLKVLREAGLVRSSRRGRWIDYTLTEDAGARLRAALPVAGRPVGTR
ncbi:metalloregulator ArsR/SmtB family transcription factor [Actinoplanes sp. NPDC049802]|uniref:ArsR/SmtB family transcription factor n=1 Tax=Actinoplanes sp. NPDC049802 TaxID=3154742 RepID=UPI0033EB226D